MKHARQVCNPSERFLCADCTSLATGGYQIVDTAQTRFVCRACYGPIRAQFPAIGETITRLLPAAEIFSGTYDPTASSASQARGGASAHGGRADGSAEGTSTLTLKYRFTTDNKLQVILPGHCRIDGRSYELVVRTEDG